MPLRVLVVDDAEIMRESMRKILTDMGFEVVGLAADGRAACLSFAELKPDVVMMDVVMPGMSGIEALQQIRRTHQDARVILITAVDHQASILEAFRLGAVDYIVKPFERERVEEALQRVAGACQVS